VPHAITAFNTGLHHIYIDFFVTDRRGVRREFSGILDTGAPRTEFNNAFLKLAGFDIPTPRNISIHPDLQTQKHNKLVIPRIEICGQTLDQFEVMVSHIDRSCEIAALIGLDFFRRFCVTIDYRKGVLITEPYREATKLL
jgi:hypothetical protein